MRRAFLLFCILLNLWTLSPPSQAEDEVLIAVASNFHHTLSKLRDNFIATQTQGAESPITLISGSTGHLYTQIAHGAPYHAFFAADDQRPKKLEQQGLTMQGERYTYALGQLAVWSPKSSQQDHTMLFSPCTDIAIANPNIAPYGRAAIALLESLQWQQRCDTQLIRANNVGLAFLYVQTTSTPSGIIALSQLKQNNISTPVWIPNADRYPPIRQQAVRMKQSPKHLTPFWNFLKTPATQVYIQTMGYRTIDAVTRRK